MDVESSRLEGEDIVVDTNGGNGRARTFQKESAFLSEKSPSFGWAKQTSSGPADNDLNGTFMTATADKYKRMSE